MNSSVPMRAAVMRLIIAVFVVFMATPAPLTAGPAFIPIATPIAPAPVSTLAQTAEGPVSISLESSATAVRSGDEFNYAVSIEATDKVPYVETRFRLKRPTGRLIFQRTKVEQNLSPGKLTYTFGRNTTDLDLAAGSYPIEITCRYSYKGDTTELTLEGQMLVYDDSARQVPVVIVVRVSGQPLAGPSGRFVVDPEKYSGARSNVDAVSRLVLNDSDVRLSVAISPLLLQEWRRISEGFEIAGPEGVERVPPTSAVSVKFAETLQTLRAAMATGRLELMSLGYADPDPTQLVANGLGDDVVAQYRSGTSAIFASIESSASTGTAPAGGCLPPQLVDSLASTEVSYTVLSASCTRSGGHSAASGAYHIGRSALVALVADDAASDALGEGDVPALAERVFNRYSSKSGEQPVVATIQLEPGSADAAALGAGVRLISGQPWMRMSLARESAAKPKGRVSVESGKLDSHAPTGYWRDVADARRWSEALALALPPGDARATTARTDSLIAQCSAWAGSQGDWALAERGRSFSVEALNASKQVLEKVTLTVKPVTLAGDKGEIPASITNGNDLTLRVAIKAEPSAGISSKAPSGGELELRPQENFIEIPVDLNNSLSGRVNVQVLAGDVVLAQQVVTVSASILDKIAIIGGIVVLMVGLLVFIVRRVRSAEAIERRPQYTDEDET